MAVVDAFDALYYGRPYRAPVSWEAARGEIARSGGTHFDPKVVDVFLSIDWPQELPGLLGPVKEGAHL